MRQIALLCALLLLPAVVAQPQFSDDHVVRIAPGDIPTTQFAEPAGVWNYHHTVQVSGTTYTADVPAGHQLTLLECLCNFTTSGNTLTFEEGNHEVRFSYSAGSGTSTGGSADANTVVLYVLSGAFVTASEELPDAMPSTASNPGFDIYTFQELSSTFWFATSPSGPTFVKPTADEAGFPFIPVILALLAGMAIWYMLVQKGMVQARSRKQVTQVAAHVEAAKEPKPVLEARKRVLMAGLKELELAKQGGAVETETYDLLKSELKKETVTVMRAIEEA